MAKEKIIKKILIIDGIADYSIIWNDYLKNVLDYYLMSLYHSLVRDYEVGYMDLREKENSLADISYKMESFSPDIIFTKCTLDNIYNIKNLVKSLKINLTKVYLISISNNWNLGNKGKKVLKCPTIILDESKSIRENLNMIYIASGVVGSIPKSTFKDAENLNNKTICINTGYGCDRTCNFCEIKGTKSNFRPVEELKDEITDILSKGVRYFHLLNHNISYNIGFISEFCKQIKTTFNKTDFSWSCSLCPEEIIKNLDIIRELKEAKCEIVRLLVFGVSEDINSYFKINLSQEILITLISKFYEAEFTSVIIDIVVGSPVESTASQHELELFVKEAIDCAPGMIEFNLLDWGKTFDSNVYLNDSNKIKNKDQKQTQLLDFKNKMNSLLHSLMKDSIAKMPQKHRISHCILSSKGFSSKYFSLLLSGSAVYALFNECYYNEAIKFSWEIIDNIESYAPVLFTNPYFGKNNNSLLLQFDPLFSRSKNSDINKLMIEGLNFEIFNLISIYTTVGEIINHVARIRQLNRDEARRKVTNFCNDLESLNFIAYTKILS